MRKSDETKWAVKIIDKQSLSREDEEALQTEVTILQVRKMQVCLPAAGCKDERCWALNLSLVEGMDWAT